MTVDNNSFNPEKLNDLREKAHAYLHPKRVPHVVGCEETAVRLARLFDEDPEKAAIAAILHDITKKLDYEEHLMLINRYAVVCDEETLANRRLLHPVTGAALAGALFGIAPDIRSAIRWHTTGRPEMTKLEKIIYLADYIEPSRDFPGVEPLRRLVHQSLDAGMALGLKMSLEEIRTRGEEPHRDSFNAFEYYKEYLPNG